MKLGDVLDIGAADPHLLKIVEICEEPNTGLCVIEENNHRFTIPWAILQAIVEMQATIRILSNASIQYHDEANQLREILDVDEETPAVRALRVAIQEAKKVLWPKKKEKTDAHPKE